MPNVVLLGVAQDGGVPQAGCSCSRCVSVLKNRSPELFPVALGIEDGDGCFHLIEASRTIAKQLYLWAESASNVNNNNQNRTCCSVISPIQSVTLTHLHLAPCSGKSSGERCPMMVASPKTSDRRSSPARILRQTTALTRE